MCTPIHPGEILEDELNKLGINVRTLAKHTNINSSIITQILKGHMMITYDTALRFGRFFGTSIMFWINLQTAYERDCAVKTHREEEEGLPGRKSLEDGLQSAHQLHLQHFQSWKGALDEEELKDALDGRLNPLSRQTSRATGNCWAAGGAGR